MKLYNFNKSEGFFIEAGAYDGVVVSNTLLMEVKHNWTGKLIIVQLLIIVMARIIQKSASIFEKIKGYKTEKDI